MRFIYLTTLMLGFAALGPATTSNAQTKPKTKAVSQTVNPAPVNYWLDVSTGETGSGGGMMGSLMGGMMAKGAQGGASGSGNAYGNLFGGNTNWFGAANSGAAGKRTDIAIFDRRQAGTVSATQTIPSVLRLGASLPLLAPPPAAPSQRTPFEDKDPEMPQGRMKMTIKAYWGCGGTIRQGQPRIQTFEMGGPQGMAMYGSTVQGRYERDRGATSNNKSSIWPNRTSNNAIPNGASLLGDHRITGTGLPESLGFTIPAAQDFMPDLGLRTSGAKSGILSLSWSNLPTASSYFVAATGMVFSGDGAPDGDKEMTMITWSASELPESGMGLLNYLSNTNQDNYLRDKVILPAGTTSCQIPSGIFAETMMITLDGIAYGRELNLVYPARPADIRVPWNQEWTARVRVKSRSSIVMMGDMMSGQEGTGRASRRNQGQNQAQNQGQNQGQNQKSNNLQNLPKCKPVENAAAAAAGRAILGAATGGLLGGRSRNTQRPGVDCTP